MRRALGLALGLVACVCVQGASVWVEGEAADVKKTKPHPWWYDRVKTDVLSGGAWLSHFSDSGPGEATFQVKVPAKGDYVFWLRANPTKSKLDYLVDEGKWTPVDFQNDVRGQMNIAVDNKPDLRFIAWVKVGTLALDAGAHVFRFRFHSDAQNHGAIDCFCLSDDGFVPSGTTKPGGTVSATRDAPPEDAIWIEGESCRDTNMKGHSWYDSVKKDVLSGGRWLSHFDGKTEGRAAFAFESLKTDDYVFWLRANPLRSGLDWRLDGGDWQTVDFAGDVRGRMNIASDNKPDMRYIAWVKAGKVRLAKGEHRIEFRSNNGKLHNHAAIDCFVFTRIPFVPSGKNRPSIAAAAKPDDWFVVSFDDDALSPDSVIDMSRLVEAPAGQHGFLQADGDSLRFAKSDRPVKFWGVNANLDPRATPEKMTQRARWLRKYGINQVRQHTVIGAMGLLRPDGTLDPKAFDRYDRWFAALKEQGIYTIWSVVYPHHGAFLRPEDALPKAKFDELDRSDKGRDGSKVPIVSNDYINMDRDIQDIVLRYFTVLLNHRNPYTGLAYKDDPALAVVEFQNESNLFFHTLNDLRGKAGEHPYYSRLLRRGFFAFVKGKYGTREAVAKAWGGKWDRDDKWDQGELGLMAAYQWGTEGPAYEFKGQFRRCGDYIAFLEQVQRAYYQHREKELRQLGFRGVTVTTAWFGVGGSNLANLYCDSVAGMIDRHNYCGGGAGGHRIAEGKVSNMTHLDQPGRGLFSIGFTQVAGKPFGVSEWSMTPPAPFKAEAAPLMAFYGMGLQGWDSSSHFSCGAARMEGGWPGLGKYVSQTPHYMGQFPALALAVYRGDIEEGKIVASRKATARERHAGRDVLGGAVVAENKDYKELAANLATPPELFGIGCIVVGFDNAPPAVDPAPFWDKEKKLLTSTTGQLRWDYGRRLVLVGAPRTQAVIGFASGRRIRLPQVQVETKTPFVSLIFTALDDRPVGESSHILVTAMARDKQTGTQYNADWSKLETIGGPPLLMEPVQATIKLRGPKPAQIRPLDVYGVPRPETVAVQDDGSFAIDGTYKTYYYEIRR
jgi:hypothetical protein